MMKTARYNKNCFFIATAPHFLTYIPFSTSALFESVVVIIFVLVVLPLFRNAMITTFRDLGSSVASSQRATAHRIVDPRKRNEDPAVANTAASSARINSEEKIAHAVKRVQSEASLSHTFCPVFTATFCKKKRKEAKYSYKTGRSYSPA